jgi:diguanylate cyclase (GGDEF)-like protein
LVKARLKDELVEMEFAAGGAEALEKAGAFLPDLVLLDVDMPDLSGMEVIRRLKSEMRTMSIPVIFLTGSDSPEAKVKGFELGAVDYVTKPFDPTELRARVRATLRTKYLMDLLSQKAMIDGLTGTWNRAYFDERLPAEVSLSRRTGNQVSLVMLDIDHFKEVNDTYGHPFGDDVLRAVARALGARVRVSDVVCRFGGEEFAIILPNTDAPRATMLAEDLRLLISEMVILCGKTLVPVTASLGVSDLGRDQEASEMIKAADGAMYASKRSGRNRVTSAFDPNAQGVMIPGYRAA